MNFSQEMINAYADGELQGSEKAEFENALLNDAELQQKLDEVHSIKIQLSQAYQNIDVPVHMKYQTSKYRMSSYVALLLVAFVGGWVSGELVNQSVNMPGGVNLFAQGQHIEEQVSGKYILHIGIHDNEKFKRTLDEAETLLASYQKKQKLVELEVVANAGGLDLFREGASQYSERVRQLSVQYPNIKFIACANAIERLQERGLEPNLINAVHTGPTALDQVVKRMSEGWSYVKI